MKRTMSLLSVMLISLVAIHVGHGSATAGPVETGPVDPVLERVDSSAIGTTQQVTDDFEPLTPTRTLDTRTGLGVNQPGRIGPGVTIDLDVFGVGSIPSAFVEGVVFNLTATAPTARTFITHGRAAKLNRPPRCSMWKPARCSRTWSWRDSARTDGSRCRTSSGTRTSSSMWSAGYRPARASKR